MSNHPIPNKQLLLPLALLSTFILILLGVSVFFVAPNIQNDLAKEVEKVLTQHAIPANISVSGREVILSGTVSDLATKKKASLVTQKVCGIRYVDNQLLTEKTEQLVLLESHHSEKKSEKVADNTKEKQLNLSNSKNSQALSPSVVAITPKVAAKQAPQPTHPTTDKEVLQHKVEKEKPTLIITSNKQANKLEPKVATKKSLKQKAANNEELQTTAKTKTNILDYDSMLAAMNAYNQKKKGRNQNASNSKQMLIQFEAQTSTLLSTSHKELNTWVTHFKSSNSKRIVITVTNESTSLATRRAKTIHAYFINQGIKAERIEVKGEKGEYEVTFIEK